MKKYLKLGLLASLLSFPLVSSAQAFISKISDLGLSNRPIIDIVANFTKWLLAIFGFIAIIAFVIAGIQYLISAGNEDMQQRAKRSVTYAIIGVIVGLSGYIVVSAIQAAFGGNNINF